MLKKLIVFFIYFNVVLCGAQVASFNQFPAMQPQHILDENLENISFALGMRVLVSDYEGPLIRLRRDSDDSEMDFYCNNDDKVDVDSINTWRGSANVYIVIWHDQSGLNRNALQATNSKQPRFFPDSTFPYFQGNGTSQHLDINTSIQTLTNAGVNGTILGIFSATKKSQNTFGALVGRDRWSAHINWSNGNLYFDPGICCNNPRFFNNAAGENLWRQYTMIRGTSTVAVRQNEVTRFSGNHTNGRCTITNNFGILYANGNGGHATTKVSEMIMYNTDISITAYSEIEGNQITFWNL